MDDMTVVYICMVIVVAIIVGSIIRKLRDSTPRGKRRLVEKEASERKKWHVDSIGDLLFIPGIEGSQIVKPADVVSVELLTEDATATAISPGSQVVRAAAGAAIAGLPGAVVGAATARRTGVPTVSLIKLQIISKNERPLTEIVYYRGKPKARGELREEFDRANRALAEIRSRMA